LTEAEGARRGATDRKMRWLRISNFHPDPMLAIMEAKAAAG